VVMTATMPGYRLAVAWILRPISSGKPGARPILSEQCSIYLTNLGQLVHLSDACYTVLTNEAPMRGLGLDLRTAILGRMSAQSSTGVWTPVDFLDLGSREAVDQALHRLTASTDLRRIVRGLYDKPGTNRLTGKPTYPDYQRVIDALARRDQVRMVVDGITAANDLGLTDAVPARAVVLTDARLKPIKLGNLTIHFQHAAPSRLHWAGHPAMRVVQALYWVRDLLPRDMDRIRTRLISVLQDPDHGAAIRNDLRQGLPSLPEWMQTIVRDLLRRTDGAGQPQGKPKAARSGNNAAAVRDQQPDHQQDDHDGQHDNQHDEQQHQAHDGEKAHPRGLR
jgi:Family of unknown function (DUF6088)